MLELVSNKRPTNELEVKDLTPDMLTNKLVVSVYKKKASLLVEDYRTLIDSKKTDSNIRFRYFTSLRDATFKSNSIYHLVDRMKSKNENVFDGNVVRYYIFDSLQEFAKMAIENDWQ